MVQSPSENDNARRPGAEVQQTFVSYTLEGWCVNSLNSIENHSRLQYDTFPLLRG